VLSNGLNTPQHTERHANTNYTHATIHMRTILIGCRTWLTLSTGVLQGFYLYVSPVARLHITPEQEARNGQISGGRASRSIGRPLLVNTWPGWASALVH